MRAHYYLLPLIAGIANLALLAENLRKAHSLNRLLFFLYLLLAGINLSAAALLRSDSHQSAMVWLYVLRHFLFFLPVILLVIAAYLSGRTTLNAFVVAAAVYATCFLLLGEVTFWTDSNLLVIEMRKHPWGYFPVLSRIALILLSTDYLVCFAVSVFWLVHRKSEFSFLNPRAILAFYLIWWPGIMLNAIPLSGVSFLPLGNGIDAVVSLLFSSYIHKKREGFFSAGPLTAVSELLSSISFGLLCGFFLLVFLPDVATGDAVPVITGLITATGSLFFLQWLRREGTPRAPGLSVRLSKFGLSKQELRICELLSEGYSKRDILVFLNIADGTFRNHLMNIYEKTIHKTSNIPGDSRDKLQRLTVFLHKT